MNAFKYISILFLIPLISYQCNSNKSDKKKSFAITNDTQRPNFSEECIKLIEKSYLYMTQQQKIMEDVYQLSSYERWDYNQLTGKLTFSDGDTVKLEIDYEEVGSISESTNTWLWAWDNESIEVKVKSEIIKIKEYGLKNKFEPLTKSKWYASEYDGWEMASVSAYLLNAKGVYKVPAENNYSFMIFKNIKDLR